MISRCRAVLPMLLAGLLAWPAAGCDKVPLLAPTGSTITLTSAAVALPQNGTTTIIAQVLEAAGTPPQDGTLVTFTTTLGSIEPSEAETVGGRVTVKFVSGTQSGTARVTASSGGATVGANGAITILVGAAAVGGISVSASPTTLPAIGGTATITAITRDSSGNPLPSIPVSFSTDGGSLSTSLVIADQSGMAQTLLTTAVTATVTVTAGTSATTGTGNTTTTTPVTGTVKVTVTLGPSIVVTGATPNPVVVGQPVSVTLAATVPTGGSPIRAVVVNWGDGSTTSAATGTSTVAHTYGSTGTFTITATATDVTGNTATTQTAIQVVRVPRPTVGLTFSPASPTTGTTVTFTITSTPATGDSIQNNRLAFGDGTFVDLGSGSVASHVYTQANTYTATVTTTTANGASGTASAVVVVQ